MSGIAFTQSQDFVKFVRDRLMEQIIIVNDYSKQSSDTRDDLPLKSNLRDRLMLENITKELHIVSQTADTGIANANMSIKICEEMLEAYHSFTMPCKEPRHEVECSTEIALKYVLESMRCQRHWLVRYKARKDTAMNFVFNMVTQTDSAANVDIALKMAKDSSPMNAITILTMVFLPGTFVGAIFSSEVFSINAK
ncbi:hypothetical protein BDV96DRAFT_593460 [Lophiotrema nucula]|uniref:Uncharacterized protein n=1 Tax=Lophiotrema nucula TaxID=690887 RepID=A0A6A5ZU21_9PLEO|nr:hypothetical protein BDV96DRAFT_593460 [Lophiotrema nucula]